MNIFAFNIIYVTVSLHQVPAKVTNVRVPVSWRESLRRPLIPAGDQPRGSGVSCAEAGPSGQAPPSLGFRLSGRGSSSDTGVTQAHPGTHLQALEPQPTCTQHRTWTAPGKGSEHLLWNGHGALTLGRTSPPGHLRTPKSVQGPNLRQQ